MNSEASVERIVAEVRQAMLNAGTQKAVTDLVAAFLNGGGEGDSLQKYINDNIEQTVINNMDDVLRKHLQNAPVGMLANAAATVADSIYSQPSPTYGAPVQDEATRAIVNIKKYAQDVSKLMAIVNQNRGKFQGNEAINLNTGKAVNIANTSKKAAMIEQNLIYRTYRSSADGVVFRLAAPLTDLASSAYKRLEEVLSYNKIERYDGPNQQQFTLAPSPPPVQVPPQQAPDIHSQMAQMQGVLMSLLSAQKAQAPVTPPQNAQAPVTPPPSEAYDPTAFN
jgi:hypothetical protein